MWPILIKYEVSERDQTHKIKEGDEMKSKDVDWLFKEITSENLKSLKLRGINWCSNVRGIYKHKHVQER